MKIKKNFLRFFSSLLILGIAACGTTEKPAVVVLPTATKLISSETPMAATNTPEPTPVIQIPSMEKFPDEVEVSFWYSWSGKAAGVIEQLVSEFNTSNLWNIKVIAFQNGNADYLSHKIIQSLSEKERPNIIAADVGFIRSLALNSSTLLDLSAYVNHPVWGISEQEQLLYPVTFWQQDMVGNSRFGLPAQRNAYFLFYNTTWAKDLGFNSPPSTPDDFLNQSCAAARNNSFDNDNENDGTGGWIFNSRPVTVLSWMKAFGGGEIPLKDKDTYQLESAANEKAFAFLQQLVRLGCAWVPRDSDPYQYFSTRKALFYSGSLEDILNQKKIASRDNWTILPYPSLDGHAVILSDGFSYAILRSDSEHDLAAWLFARWMQKPENQARLIEGTSTFPLTSNVKERLSKFSQQNPAWVDSLQYLPLVKSAPLAASWLDAGKVLQDAAWQVIQSNIKPGNISEILIDAEKLIKELVVQ